MDVTVNSDTITATDERPFWVETRGWTDAQDLHVGDLLRDDDGDLLAINSVLVYVQARATVLSDALTDHDEVDRRH